MKKFKKVMLLAATTAACVGIGLSAQADVTMNRLYNPNSGEHFYTGNSAEKDNLVAAGWTYEGSGWVAPDTGSEVYRLYNPNAGDHFYTMSAAEKDNLVSLGWNYEGVGWHSGGSVALLRAYNPNASAGSHNYTTSSFEQQTLTQAGWKDEGIAWYGLAAGQAVTPAPAATTTSSSTQNLGTGVYVAGQDSKVYWYSEQALINYGNKVGNPVDLSKVFTMTEEQAIASGRTHSQKE